MADNREKATVGYPAYHYEKPHPPYSAYPVNAAVNYNQYNAENPQYPPVNFGGYPTQPTNYGNPHPQATNYGNPHPQPTNYGNPHPQPTNYGNPHPQPNLYNVENLPEYSVDNAEMLTSDTSVSVRHAFVRKVYLLITTQMAITFSIALVFTLVKGAKLWLLDKFFIVIICFVVAIVLMCAISCSPSLGRRYPVNLIILFSITLCLSFIVAFGAARTTSIAFAAAAGMTFFLTVALTIFAIQTKYDFTGYGLFVYASSILLIIFGVLAAIFHNHIAHIVYALIASALFCFYLVYDTQKIVGGKHRKYKYLIDDYVPAALTLYMDIINIFMLLLALFSND